MRVVAHYLDGRVLGGESLDVHPDRPLCHITPPDGTRAKVELAALKALFVVRTLEGDPGRLDSPELPDGDPRRPGARPVEIVFRDGEHLLGLTLHQPVADEFFFLLPADPQANNQRVLINRAAVAEIREIEVGAAGG